jgi:type IV pilus assembly protein PilV
MSKQHTLLKNTQQRRSDQQGVVLLEALVAILLFSMGVLALVGLQAAMIKNTSDSKFRADASYLAQQWVGQMWSDPDPGNQALYLIPDNTDPRFDISTLLPSGTRTVTRTACAAPMNTLNCPIVVTITWIQPGRNEQHQFTTTFNIAGG